MNTRELIQTGVALVIGLLVGIVAGYLIAWQVHAPTEPAEPTQPQIEATDAMNRMIRDFSNETISYPDVADQGVQGTPPGD